MKSKKGAEAKPVAAPDKVSVSLKNGADRPNVIALPPVIFLGCAVVSWLLHLALPLRLMSYTVSLPLGGALALVSFILTGWAWRAMREAGTNVRPDRPTLAIVRSGPYGFTRNPMYLSLCLLQLALGLLLNGWIPLLFTIPLALLLHFGVVLREEIYLESKFGGQYADLKRKVRRWL